MVVLAPPASAAPGNDNVSDAVPLVVPSSMNAVDFSDATLETGEPTCGPYGGGTVWYQFTPAADARLRITTSGWPESIGLYAASVPLDAATMLPVDCRPYGDPMVADLVGGTTYYLQLATAPWVPQTSVVSIEVLVPPANDNFADAQVLTLNETVDPATTDASQEPDEDFCAGTSGSTVWYSFRPTSSGTLALSLPQGGFADVYTGTGYPLDPVSCGVPGFVAAGGTQYWIQIVNAPAGSTFAVAPAPAPSPSPWMYNVTGMAGMPVEIYANNTGDPVSLFPTIVSWDFGDGTPGSTDPWRVEHTYAKDGDYTVTLTSTTSDGRSGSGTLLIPIRTHDVSVVSFTAPTNARAGQSKTFVAGIRNTHYVETAQVVLMRGGPGGWVVVTTANVTLPVKAANKSTSVNLPYVFTAADARAGTVSFKVQVYLNVSELQTTDNEMVCPPVRVTK